MAVRQSEGEGELVGKGEPDTDALPVIEALRHKVVLYDMEVVEVAVKQRVGERVIEGVMVEEPLSEADTESVLETEGDLEVESEVEVLRVVEIVREVVIEVEALCVVERVRESVTEAEEHCVIDTDADKEGLVELLEDVESESRRSFLCSRRGLVCFPSLSSSSSLRPLEGVGGGVVITPV